MTGRRAACWAVVTKNGRYGYVTNAGRGNISGFAIAQDGSAALLDADGVTAVTGGNPCFAEDGAGELYLLTKSDGVIRQVMADPLTRGLLTPTSPGR